MLRLWISVAVGLACFFAVGAHLARTQSASYDEVTDVGAGYALLRGSDQWRLDPEHLPLSKVIAALALPKMVPELPVPERDPSPRARWLFGNKVLYETQHDPLQLLYAGRLPLLCLNALLIPLVGWFTYRLGGTLAAGVAVALASTEPLWLAHSTLIGSDALASVLLYATAVLAFTLVHRVREGSLAERSLYSAALCVTAALCVAAKYYTPPALVCVWIAAAFDAYREGRHRSVGPWLIGAGVVAALVGVCFAWGLPAGPDRYLEGFREVGKHHVQGYGFYAFGDFFTGTNRGYFLRALCVKASIPVLVLTVVWAVLAHRSQASFGVKRVSALLVLPPLGHALALSFGAPPLGVRYMLPLLPFMFTLAGLAAHALWKYPRTQFLVPALACLQLWSVQDALRYSPIAFFNGLGCHTAEIPPCLDDSNVDWGHALPALDTALKSRFAARDVRIAYFGSSPFRAYVQNATSMGAGEWTMPQRSVYAISLHFLARSPTHSWVRTTRPDAVVAGTYAVFDLRMSSPTAAPRVSARTHR